MSPLSIGGKEVGFEPPPSPEIARQSLPDDQFELSVLDPDERAFSTSSEKDEDNDEDVTSKFFHNNRFEALQQEQISTSYIEAQNNSSVSEKNCLHCDGFVPPRCEDCGSCIPPMCGDCDSDEFMVYRWECDDMHKQRGHRCKHKRNKATRRP